MTTSTYERSTWAGTRAGQFLNEWEATRASTQLATRLLGEEDEAAEARDIGRDVGNLTRELFVSCDPAEALLQQFETVAPEFIAVHDIGTHNARKLLAGIAAASGKEVHKLLIRRQGFGTTLATIEFLDCDAADGKTVRLYATEVDADTVTRVSMSRALMAHSQLTVAMVGDLPSHALSAALQPLRDAVLKGPWPCRHMLFLPLAVSAALPSLVAEFGAATAMEVKATPQVSRPVEAWSFLGATWNRLQAGLHGEGGGALLLPLKTATVAATATQPTAPVSTPVPVRPPPPASSGMVSLDLREAPATAPVLAAHTPANVGTPKGLDLYAAKLNAVPGVQSVCIFEPAKRQPVLYLGQGPSPESLVNHSMTVLSALGVGGRALGLGSAIGEVTASLGHHTVLIRALPHFPGLMVHAIIAKPASNLTMARLAMQKMDAALAASSPATAPEAHA